MKPGITVTGAALLIACTGLPVAAQACMGRAPWEAGSTRFGVLGRWSSAGRGFGGHATFGRPLRERRAIFAQVTGTRTTPRADPELEAAGGVANPEYALLVEAGVELPLQGRVWAMVCPTLGVGFVSGPEILIPDRSSTPPGELERERTGPVVAAGAWVGAGERRTGGLRLYPALGLHVVHERITDTAEGSRDGGFVDESVARRSTSLRLTAAAGFPVGTRVVLRPRVAFDVFGSAPGAELEVAASFSFAG